MDERDEETERILEASRFWIQKVFVPFLVFIGVGGNCITVMVLTRKRMRSSTNIYLSALAIADIIYLLFVFILSFSHYSSIHDGKYELYWRFFGLAHWLCDAASGTSVWLTVSFTLERYIAVCHPMKGKVLCTENRAKSIIVIIIIICVLTTASTTFEHQLALNEQCVVPCNFTDSNTTITSESSNITTRSVQDAITIHQEGDHISNNELISTIKAPKSKNCSNVSLVLVPYNAGLFDKNLNFSVKLPTDKSKIHPVVFRGVVYEPSDYDAEHNDSNEKRYNNTYFEFNGTCCRKKMFKINTEYTNLGMNVTYKTVIYWFSAIVFGILPICLIATFNSLLVKAVYRSQSRRREMTNSQFRRILQENFSMANENRITVMLIGVVILFLVCQTPTAAYLIYDYFLVKKTRRIININLIMGNIFNSLLAVNAAFNFVFYCVMSKKYRTTFKKLFFERKVNRQDTLQLTSSTRHRSTRNRFASNTNGFRRNASEYYHTPRNLETQSLTSMPRSKSLMVRPPGKSKSTDFLV